MQLSQTRDKGVKMRFLKNFLLGCLVIVGSVATANAQSACPRCGQFHNYRPAAASGYQAQAEAEARKMAARRYKGHIQGVVPGVRFCGVGWSSSSRNAPTCTPRGGMTLVADAAVRGADGWYRVRYWR